MEPFTVSASQVLGVKIPQAYAAFMETHGKKLAADPVHQGSWLAGLGSPDFVIGTTLAFRGMIPNFSPDHVVIGYVGTKTIIVNKVYEELDEYLILNTRNGSILTVDSLGVTNRIAEDFDAWVGPELLRAKLREKHTSNLTVIVFENEGRAEEARRRLLELRREGSVDLENAVVVVRQMDGSIRTSQMDRPARKGGLAGSITGLIVGSIFFSPVIGAVLGAVAGAVARSLQDMGIDQRFMQDLSQKFQPGCSALFTLVRKADPARVEETFLGFGGKVLVNSVSREQEAAIQALLDAAES